MVHMSFVGLILFGFVFSIDGTHFLGGTITWQPLNASATGTPVAIVITQTYSWTYSIITCTNAMITNHQLVPNYSALSTTFLLCIANCGTGSAGYSSPHVIPYCLDFSVTIGVTVGQRSDTVYLQVGDDFSVAYQDGGWRPLATASSADWSVSSRINVTPRPDNNLYNNAPVAAIMSPINIFVNQPTIINIPIGDADGDTVYCRWATKSNGVDECADVCPPGSLPPGTVIYPNCTIIITGQNVGDWFAVAFMAEDFINSSSATPLSSTPVQFLVDVVASPTCTNLPEIIGVPVVGSCILVQVNQTFSSQLIAISNCGSTVTIDDIATLSFAGMIKGSLTMINSTTYYKSLTWTPTTAQIGYQVMCAMALDSQSSQSAQYCFKFYVSTENLCVCPGESCTTTITSTTTTTTATTSTTSTTSTNSAASTTSTTSGASTTSTTSTTSTESTTSTSTFSTTTIIVPNISTPLTNALSTTSSSKTNDFNIWIIIGPIAGILVLLGLILFSCLYWYYCSPYGIGRLPLADCKGPFELYHMGSINQSVVSNDTDDNKNLWFDDEDTTESFENNLSSRGQSSNTPASKRPLRKKPNRVTIFSLPPNTSTSTFTDSTMIFNFHQTNQRPYYQQGKNDASIRHVYWRPQKETSFLTD